MTPVMNLSLSKTPFVVDFDGCVMIRANEMQKLLCWSDLSYCCMSKTDVESKNPKVTLML